MKKVLLTLPLLLLPLLANAQAKFGYFSLQEALRSMPGYAIAQKNLSTLSAQYDDEMRLAEDEFNRKYEEFLDGQRELAPSILQKRQTELQQLMSRNIAFRAEAKRLLSQAEEEAYAPLRKQLTQLVQQIGHEQGYAFILNTDNDSLPYVDPEQGPPIMPLIKASL
jgi:outer membrane protein